MLRAGGSPMDIYKLSLNRRCAYPIEQDTLRCQAQYGNFYYESMIIHQIVHSSNSLLVLPLFLARFSMQLEIKAFNGSSIVSRADYGGTKCLVCCLCAAVFQDLTC
mmetsp:Transcript_26183/g.46697  ORF Transcript_26183/g.46697 Transcript_26183/m.46697 type:complete len:106 (-) Transcript_26183:6851-7168(-)